MLILISLHKTISTRTDGTKNKENYRNNNWYIIYINILMLKQKKNINI